MIVDAHAHLDPRLLDLEPMLAKMDAAGVDRVALIPTINEPLPETPKTLLALTRHAMCHRPTRPLAHLVHRALMTRGGDLRLGGQIVRIHQQPDNEPVARAVAAHPDRFWGWIFLNPATDPQVLDTLERWRAVPGMIGIKLHPHWHDYRTEILAPVLARAQELGLPVLIHLGFGKRGDIRAMATDFPRLHIICAHAGFPLYGDLWRIATGHPRVHVDLSSPYIDEALARAAVRALGARRCIYGTDSPYGFEEPDHTYDYRHILGWIARMPLREDERDAIVGGNLRALLES
ncbi:MAG: amidohydrolase [Deltaproteobacteria bacterium]|nr:amidohydrolase [Deltaproteobacteria bacterium]